eukprot:3406451-Amphidinium_carterae.1
MRMELKRKKSTELRENIKEMLQDRYYVATQNLLDDAEMTDLTEYLQMKQYLEYLIYHRDTIHLHKKRENTLTRSRKPFTITA